MIRIQRVYEPHTSSEPRRVLVDRLWPRGLRKANANIDLWVKHLAPSNELRQWYGHDPAKWSEFKQRYYGELEANPEAVEAFLEYLRDGNATLVYSSREERLNNAVALQEYVETRL